MKDALKVMKDILATLEKGTAQYEGYKEEIKNFKEYHNIKEDGDELAEEPVNVEIPEDEPVVITEVEEPAVEEVVEESVVEEAPEEVVEESVVEEAPEEAIEEAEEEVVEEKPKKKSKKKSK